MKKILGFGLLVCLLTIQMPSIISTAMGAPSLRVIINSPNYAYIGSSFTIQVIGYNTGDRVLKNGEVGLRLSGVRYTENSLDYSEYFSTLGPGGSAFFVKTIVTTGGGRLYIEAFIFGETLYEGQYVEARTTKSVMSG